MKLFSWRQKSCVTLKLNPFFVTMGEIAFNSLHLVQSRVQIRKKSLIEIILGYFLPIFCSLGHFELVDFASFLIFLIFREFLVSFLLNEMSLL